MKNVFFCLTFTLISFCSFAKSEKPSIIVSNVIEKAVFLDNITENIDNVAINYVFDAVSCYAEITYNGVVMTRVQSYGFAENADDAKANCYKNAKTLALAWITMQEEALSQE